MPGVSISLTTRSNRKCRADLELVGLYLELCLCCDIGHRSTVVQMEVRDEHGIYSSQIKAINLQVWEGIPSRIAWMNATV